MTTFEQFYELYQKHFAGSVKNAYAEAEAEHIALHGQRRYASLNSFRVILCQKFPKPKKPKMNEADFVDMYQKQLTECGHPAEAYDKSEAVHINQFGGRRYANHSNFITALKKHI